MLYSSTSLWSATNCIVASLAVCFLVKTNSCNAQIVPDGTLQINSIVELQENISLITGGTVAGGNLFHSFKEFSVPQGNTAFFNNATGTVNIITRVTGSSASNIDGLIKANGTANFFLINPQGIIFGRNAQLDTGGSFVASTASAIKFADGSSFSAETGQNTPLLTIAVPIGLQFGTTAGTIQNQSQATDSTNSFFGLSVKPEKTLALVGGDVMLQGGYMTSPGGRIELGSVAGSALVKLTSTDKGYALAYENISNFRDISLSQEAVIDGSGEGGADIQIQGNRVTFDHGSLIRSGTGGAKAGGNVVVNASESLQMKGTTAFGQFPSGLLAVTFGSGAAGDIQITTKRLQLQDGAQINAGSFGSGKGGNLAVQASELVELVGSTPTGASLTLLSGLGSQAIGTGTGGNLTINTERLVVRDGAQVAVSSFGQGQGGNLSVKAKSVELIGTSTPNSQGRVFTSGLLSRTEINPDTKQESTGSAGQITIVTERFLAKDGGTAATSTFSQGKGGNLTLIATDSVQLIGTSADGKFASSLSAQTNGAGDAGELFIKTGSLTIKDGAMITTEGIATGNAGNISAIADALILDNQGKITAATASGEGGNISLQVSNLLLLRHQSLISADAKNNGNGGNIKLNAPLIVAINNENSDIVANAFQGQGGNIDINTQGIYGLIFSSELDATRSEINASSEFGVSGNVQINTLRTDPSQGLTILPEQVVDVTGLVEQSCSASSKETRGKFVVTGRGGLPYSPYEVLSSDIPTTDWVTGGSEVARAARFPAATSKPPTINRETVIVEAQGWVVGSQGEIILTEQPPSATPASPWLAPTNCNKG